MTLRDAYNLFSRKSLRRRFMVQNIPSWTLMMCDDDNKIWKVMKGKKIIRHHLA